MTSLLKRLVLPPEVTEFEQRYVERLNRIALIACWAHLPLFVLVALANNTGPASAVILTAIVLAGPTVAFRTVNNPRTVGVVYGITSMFLGGLLVHFGQGPVQIEMHFYFFAMLAILAIYGNPMVIVSAAVTVALHHAVLWMFLPSSACSTTTRRFGSSRYMPRSWSCESVVGLLYRPKFLRQRHWTGKNRHQTRTEQL